MPGAKLQQYATSLTMDLGAGCPNCWRGDCNGSAHADAVNLAVGFRDAMLHFPGADVAFIRSDRGCRFWNDPGPSYGIMTFLASRTLPEGCA